MVIKIKNPEGLKTSLAHKFLSWFMQSKKIYQGLLYLILSMHSTLLTTEVH